MRRVLRHYSKEGFVTLAVVIALLLVGSSTTALVLMISWQADTGAALNVAGARARWLADACADYGLAQTRYIPAYAGSESLSFTNGDCTIADILNVSSTSFAIQAEGRSGEAVGRTLVEFNLSVDASGSPAGLSVGTRSHVTDF